MASTLDETAFDQHLSANQINGKRIKKKFEKSTFYGFLMLHLPKDWQTAPINSFTKASQVSKLAKEVVAEVSAELRSKINTSKSIRKLLRMPHCEKAGHLNKLCRLRIVDWKSGSIQKIMSGHFMNNQKKSSQLNGEQPFSERDPGLSFKETSQNWLNPNPYNVNAEIQNNSEDTH